VGPDDLVAPPKTTRSRRRRRHASRVGSPAVREGTACTTVPIRSPEAGSPCKPARSETVSARRSNGERPSDPLPRGVLT
jgi:hypothetical protein